MSLSTLELSMMQHEAAHFRPETVVIWRVTQVSDGQGGVIPAWAAWGTTTGHLAPNSGREQIIANKPTAVADWVISIPCGTLALEADRLVIASAGTFEAVAVLAPHSYEVHRRVLCQEAV